MRKWLFIIGAASLLIYSSEALASEDGPLASQDVQSPPVAQTLVREGDFAVKLAAVLDLGIPTEQAIAEDLLVKAGISPANGWISDYPMTPQIVGQLRDSISQAAANGKLSMTSEEAVQGLFSLTQQLNLPTPGVEGASARQGVHQGPAPQSDPAVINNYYYDYGPPVVTYYPPPPDFMFLYAWVPYPGWWFGFWFPGFYICHDFTTVVWVNTGRAVISNHVIDPVTRSVAVVDPNGRRSAHDGRPVSVLRTQQRGERSGTITGSRVSGPDMRKRHTGVSSTQRTHGFRSPEARKSAESIYSKSTRNWRNSGTYQRSMTQKREWPSGAHSQPLGREFKRQRMAGSERMIHAPAPSNGSFRPPVTSRAGDGYSAPRFSAPYGAREGRTMRAVEHSAPQRSFTGPRAGGRGGFEWSSARN